jgi:hypothetical protein
MSADAATMLGTRGTGVRLVDTFASPVSPSPHTDGTDKLGRAKRPRQYEVQLKVNINEAMAASLQRICRRLGIPEGIGARIAITQFLSQQDPQYGRGGTNYRETD